MQTNEEIGALAEVKDWDEPGCVCMCVCVISDKKQNIHVRILVSSVSFSRKGGSQVEVRLVFCPACGTEVISDQISVICVDTHCSIL